MKRFFHVNRCHIALIIALSSCLSSSLQAKTFVVTTKANAGPGSLREAIKEVNASEGPHHITFAIKSKACQKVIELDSPLDPITERVFIDGFSQPGSHPETDKTEARLTIVIDGTNISQLRSNGLELAQGSDESIISGLIIVGFAILAGDEEEDATLQLATGNGLLVASNNNLIFGMHIGINEAVELIKPNGTGILITGNRNIIGGKSLAERIVVGNSMREGIVITNQAGVVTKSYSVKNRGQHNIVIGALVGIDPSGKHPRQNLKGGITIRTENNLITHSVVSGNPVAGIILHADKTIITDSIIGLNADGTDCIDPALQPIGFQVEGSENTIRRNIISCNTDAGIALGLLSSKALIHSNFIGTDFSGTELLGNQDIGITVRGTNHSIGGTTKATTANLISGNGRDGIRVLQGSGHRISCNFLGTDMSGLCSIPNGTHGINIVVGREEASVNKLPLVAIIEQNLISGNGTDGIRIGPGSALVLRNTIGLDRGEKRCLGNGRHGVFIRNNNAPVTLLKNRIACNGTEEGLSTEPANCGITIEGENAPPAPVVILLSPSFCNVSDGICYIGIPSPEVPPAPQLTEISRFFNSLVISGILENGLPHEKYRIELFANKRNRAPITEGKRVIGVIQEIETDGDGFAEFTVALDAGPRFISATATLLDKETLIPISTSVFSENIRAC